MKNKAFSVSWKWRHYGVDPHYLKKYYQEGLDDYKNCKGVRRLGKALQWRPDPWRDINEKPRKYRSWKAHSRCRHQWEKHEDPGCNYAYNWRYYGNNSVIQMDHQRDWILERLRKKSVCVFDFHHDKGLEDALNELAYRGICSYKWLKHDLVEATLIVQENAKPKPKKGIGEKKQKGKYRRRAEQGERRRMRKEAIMAVQERIKRASRKGGFGVSRPFVIFNAHPDAANMTPYDLLHAAAKEDRIKSVTRRHKASINLLKNYSYYRMKPKAHCFLKPFEHDYKQFHTMLGQCCVWLTGHRPCEYPAWTIGMLTNQPLQEEVARRLWGWMLGDTCVRDVYGLSKNEVHEIMSLSSSIDNEQEAVVAAIAVARHCKKTLSFNLAKQIPVFGDVIYDPIKRDFIRKLVEWLVAVDANPMAAKLHDMLDFFFRSGVWRDSNFSFKGRTLQRVEQLMMQWHQDNIRRGGMSMTEFMAKWKKHDFDCKTESYNFKELLSASELMEEGQKQHNCVFSYRDLCKRGTSAIVAMRGVHNLTLEIRERRIVQIRGACNRLPYPEELRAIRQYASLKNLIIA